jgi:SH3 domain protein
MADMKTSGANRCLLIATTALVTATLPLAGLAQEQAPAPQQRYVSDKLVLNVYAQVDQSGGRVASIQTGDSVEELERSGNMVHVRLEDGREGWVGANYLTSDPPAAVKLRELQRGQKAPSATPMPAEPDKKSLEELGRLKKENATLQGQVNELQSRVSALGKMAEGAPTETPSEPEAIEEEPAQQPAVVMTAGPAWWMWSIAIVLTGGLGYASGYQTLARRLRRKFGGLKIY